MNDRIICISGRPGLYKIVKQGRRMLIVENINEPHNKFSVGESEKVMSLNDISIYCDDEDTPLFDVFNSVKEKEGGKELSFNPRKIDADKLHEYFAQVLPEYDHDRVHDSDIRKLLVWYNTLIKGGVTDFNLAKDDSKEKPAAESGEKPAE